MTDNDYLYAFWNVVMPIATEFDPDLVIGEFLHPLLRLISNVIQSRLVLMPPWATSSEDAS